MSNQPALVLERLRQPEYTGENRCLPCTGVNVAIALVVSALAAVVVFPLGVLVFVASLAAIYLRGYLVPGTPALTKRYLPDRVLSLFDNHPIEETRDEEWETVERLNDERENAVDPERFLLDVEALEPCDHEEDLCLTDAFADLLEERITTHGGEPDNTELADVFDTDPGSITLLEREYPALRIDRRIRKWPSEAALVADLAADRALRELTDRWGGVPLGQRLGILKSLRSFHEHCPRCGGVVAMSDETVESCCRSYDVIAIGCTDCDDSLFEFNPTELQLGKDETGIEP